MMYEKEFLIELQERVDCYKASFYSNFSIETMELEGNFEMKRGVCPFCHGEYKTLVIMNTKYYCFNCEASGDQVKFLMNTRKCNFEDAIKTIALWANVPMKFAKIDKADKE